MAEDSEDFMQEGEGEVENPKSDDKPATATSLAISFPSFSVNLWPPSQRTRDAIINNRIEDLSTPSIISEDYGTLPSEEASAVARRIEQEAFDIASTYVSPPSAPKAVEFISTEAVVDKWMEIHKIYSKEMCRRMIQYLKAKVSSVSLTPVEANAAPAAEYSGNASDSVPKHTEPTGEDIASGESEPAVA
ncbi:MFP1 attachment factor 1-like [Dendrobium catenatum]|uniref:MFP1 attachment factor 1 n=1 Tax=Dendrobium catenatum TaxID=906689 RepID=A0A2I0V7S0_9ASPA|nr:MFP1 attachment factor 1-like [Dendrobium catenatum]PKU59455.1 MFP1 attachment factor 1 [Dendrobium catenatum]